MDRKTRIPSMMLNSNTQRIICDVSLKTSIVLLVLCLSVLSARPKKIWAQDPIENSETNTNPIIQIYQAHISGIDGNRCPMYPSCSRYCAQAIRKHGFGIGWIMSCDRLLRCGRDEVQRSPHVRVNGHELIFDPVSANDFWWFSPQTPTNDSDVPTKYPDQSSFVPIPDVNPEHLK